MEEIDRIIEEQEKLLRFGYIDLDMIARICRNAARIVRENNAIGYVRACVNKTLLYAECIPGGSRNNETWARRKANLAEYYWMSSLHATRLMERKGNTLETCGLNSTDYALSGGSFPILLESGICIGSITVSGMKGEEDHQIVASAIAKELGVVIESVLPYSIVGI